MADGPWLSLAVALAAGLFVRSPTTIMHEGAVKKIVLDRGFGFIGSPNQPDVFFHRFDLRDGLEFDELLIERRVRFDILGTDKGPAARNVRAAD